MNGCEAESGSFRGFFVSYQQTVNSDRSSCCQVHIRNRIDNGYTAEWDNEIQKHFQASDIHDILLISVLREHFSNRQCVLNSMHREEAKMGGNDYR